MDQLANVLWAIDKAHTAPKMALDCRPGLGVLNYVYGPKRTTPSAHSTCGQNNNIFNRCSNRNQMDILMTGGADVNKGQTYMPYRGEHQIVGFPGKWWLVINIILIID